MTVDKYLGRTYHAREYNCAHLVCEVGEELHGPKLGEMLRGFLCAPSKRKPKLSDLKLGRWLKQPESPCVVLFQANDKTTHVGLFYRNRVLHINSTGVQYQPLEVVRIGFTKVRFFTCN